MQCSECGKELPADAKFCASCGAKVTVQEKKPAPPPVTQPVSTEPAPTAPVAPSVTGPPTPASVEEVFLKKWNWGAFLLNWIWAFGHGQALYGILILVLGVIPIIGTLADLGLMIYLGIKGNELAWNSGKFVSIEQLKETERVWTKWAVIIYIVLIVLLLLLSVLGVIVAIILSSQSLTEFMLFL